jgi:translocator protein
MAEPATSKPWWRSALVAVPAILLLGTLSGWLSGSGYGNPWFDALQKPFFMPPGWLFGLVWPILYVLLGLALALVLSAPPSPRRSAGLWLFGTQLLLNFAWSPIFFAAHDIDLALLTIVLMAALAAAAAGQFRRVRPLAAALMIPYLLWLCFAASLNAAIDRLNPAAGSSLLG